MKSESSFSFSLFLSSNENEPDENNVSEQNNDLAKDTKINNISFNNTENKNKDIQHPISSNNIKKQQCEQNELNNFNIDFFLPKDLKENLEVGEECLSDNELNFKNEETSSLQNTNYNNYNRFDNQYSKYNIFRLNNNDIMNKNLETNQNINDIQINNNELFSNNVINNCNNQKEFNDSFKTKKNIYDNKISSEFNDISNPRRTQFSTSVPVLK